MMYKFRQCSYEELKKIVPTYNFHLGVWNLVLPEYMTGLEIIESTEGEFVSLIYYEPDRNENCEMFIMAFEVREDLRRMGHGKSIIKQFLLDHSKSVELHPNGEDAVLFWKACGFIGDCDGMYYYYPDE